MLWIGLALLAGMTAWMGVSMSNQDQSARMARPVTIALGETIRDFMARNRIGSGRAGEPKDLAIDLDKKKDNVSIALEKRIVLTFDDGPYGFRLPVGRELDIAQTAGIIEDFSMTLFEEPESFADAAAFLRGFIADVQARGWRAELPFDIPASHEVSNRDGWKIITHLLDPEGKSLEIRIVDYGRAPKQPSWLVWPLGRSDKASHTYLVQVSVYPLGLGPKYDETIEPRRVFVTGSRLNPLPLRAWVDDPDWTPAKAGMIPTPPEVLRADPDAGKWMMPPHH